MIALVTWFTWLSTTAWATDIIVCVYVHVNVLDHSGDTWLENTSDRPARGFRVGLTPSGQGTTWHWMNDDGCVLTTAPQGTVAVAVKSNARISGVDLESWKGPSNQKVPLTSNHQITVGSQSQGYEIVVDPSTVENKSVWRNLLVGTMVFRNHDWNIDEGPSRDCCVAGHEQADGTCNSPQYEYVPINQAVQLQAWVDDSLPVDERKTHAQSRLVDSNGNDDGPGVYSHLTTEKRVVAHEIGHVILYHRAGAQEKVLPDGANAPMDNCNGTYDLAGNPEEQGDYGFLTKEYMSVALKEGWADFVAVHTFNDASTSGCDLQNVGRDHDWDLDETRDMGPAWRSAHPNAERVHDGVHIDYDDELIGTIDCEGDPDFEDTDPQYAWPPAGTDPINGMNWLEDLEDADDPQGCAATSYPAEENRTTRYDVVRMWWALRTDQGLTPAQLSNLAVNACFVTWDQNDGTGSNDAHLPWRRLEASAAHLSLTTPFDAEAGHVEH